MALPRLAAGSFCEQLHSIVSERGGASFYYPDVTKNRTLCRYEWHRGLGSDRFGLRVGIVVDVGAIDITEIEAYLTTREVVEKLAEGSPQLPEALVAEVQQEVVETLSEAFRGQQPEAEKIWYVVFHIHTPYGGGFGATVATKGEAVTLVRTRIVKEHNNRVSAVLVRSLAASKQVAKAHAFRDLTVVAALLTLAEGRKYSPTTLNWSRTRPHVGTVVSPLSMDEDRLYPRRKKWPELEQLDPTVAERFQFAWAAYTALSEPDRTEFLPALFAYYAGQTSEANSATLSVIALTAAISSLSASRRAKCPGKVSCSACGPLGFNHDLSGEVAAILQTILWACDISEQEHVTELRRILQRVYGKQRSAFVHGAQFRHEEYGQGAGLPPHMPSNDAPVQDLFEFQQDFRSLERITRRTLLEWLAKKTGKVLDRKRFAINPDRVTAKLMHSFQFTFPEAAIIGFVGPRPQI